jgi:hypothetical protein
MTLRAKAAAVLLALLVTACSHDRDPLVLDGSPRVPDAEGVVASVSAERITLDGNRSWPLSPSLQSFSTYTLETVPVRQDDGRYVQLGIEDGNVVWVAAVGVVITTPRPLVVYTGELRRVDGRRAIFRDGTVLTMDRGVVAPSPGAVVRAEIDPGRHAVVRFTAT